MFPYFGFYGNDIASSTKLQTNVWYHLTFVYDLVNHSMSIYINGKLDVIEYNKPPLQGNHNVYVSRYANGRPLRGILGAPLIRSNLVATHQDILEHLTTFPLTSSELYDFGSRKVRDESWPLRFFKIILLKYTSIHSLSYLNSQCFTKILLPVMLPLYVEEFLIQFTK